MNFIPEPSLERNALVKIAATFWNQCDIRTLVMEFSNSDLFLQEEKEGSWIPPRPSARTAKWKEIEDKVINKVKQLIIPESLKGKTKRFIQIVGLQILRWMEYHRITYLLGLDLPNEFYWSSCGTIDKKKTATVLVSDGTISITTRYKLACIYCLEEDILKLWDEISESQRTHLYDVEDLNKVLRHYLVVLWECIIKGQFAKIENMVQVQGRDSVYKYSLQYAADCGNKAAVEYFWQKIAPSARSSLMINFYFSEILRDQATKPPKEYSRSEVLFFLLSQMNLEEQEKVLENNYRIAFKCFLDWPFQCFLSRATHLRHVLTEIDINILVFGMIYRKVLDGYEDYDYQRMFGEFWQQIPEIDKIVLLNPLTLKYLLITLLYTNHEKNLRLILDEVSEKQKKWILFNSERYFQRAMIFNYSLDMLKVFIRLCVSSKDDVIRLKEEFEKSLFMQEMILVKPYLDELVSEYDKRKCDNEENIANLPKRICNLEF